MIQFHKRTVAANTFAVFFLMFYCSQNLFAQYNDDEVLPQLSYLYDRPNLLPTMEKMNLISAGGMVKLNSNAIPLGLGLRIMTGGAIEDKHKKSLLTFPGKRRNIEIDIKAGLHYQRRLEKSGIHIYVGYYYRNIHFGNVTTDLVKLALEGNNQFEDKKADFSKMNFESVQYNQYSVGIGKEFNNLYAAAMLSFIQGNNDVQIKNKDGYMYTAPYGEYIDFAYGFEYNQAHKGAPKFFKPYGLGFSADLHLSYKLSKGMILFDVEDLGFIQWGNESFNYANDTTIRYEGLDIGDVLGLNLNTGSLINTDTLLKHVIAEKTTNKYKTVLPATFMIAYSFRTQLKNTPIQLNFGLSTRIMSKYYAMAYAKANFFLPKNVVTSVSMSGGGYSVFNLGWDIGYQSENIDFVIGTHNLLGLLAINYYPSTSCNLRFAYKF